MKEKTNVKINLIRTILIVMLIITFFIIFSFSNQDGEESGGLSRAITEGVTKNVKSIQKLEQTKKEKVLKRIEGIIRKIVHFSIYTLVGLLLMALFSTYKLKEFHRIGISLIIGIIYAISDEIHQMFIADRTSKATDVMIDSFGVLFGILLVMLVIKLYKIKCGKNKF